MSLYACTWRDVSGMACISEHTAGGCLLVRGGAVAGAGDYLRFLPRTHKTKR